MRSNVSANSARLVVLICAMMASSSFFAATRSAFWPFEEIVAFFQRVVLGDGIDVDGADGVELAAQRADERFDLRPIGRRAGLFGETLIKVQKRVRLGREQFQIDLIPARDVFVEMVLPQPQLRRADFQLRAAVEERAERLTAGAQVGVERFGGVGGIGVFLAGGGDVFFGGGEFGAGGDDRVVEVGGLGGVAFEAAAVFLAFGAAALR